MLHTSNCVCVDCENARAQQRLRDQQQFDHDHDFSEDPNRPGECLYCMPRPDREGFLPTNAAIAEQIRAAMNETKANAERMFGGMLAELVEARAILHELLPYCRTHVNQESFRDAINRAERLLTPKTKGGTV